MEGVVVAAEGPGPLQGAAQVFKLVRKASLTHPFLT